MIKQHKSIILRRLLNYQYWHLWDFRQKKLGKQVIEHQLWYIRKLKNQLKGYKWYRYVNK